MSIIKSVEIFVNQMFSLQKYKIENIKSLIKVFMASILPILFVIVYSCISYAILRLFLIFIEIYLIFTERSTILKYIRESLGGSLTSTLFRRFYYISDDG